MKFEVRRNEEIIAFSEMFKTKEEVEEKFKSDECFSRATFVHEDMARCLGFPCGGWYPANGFSKPLEVDVVLLKESF